MVGCTGTGSKNKKHKKHKKQKNGNNIEITSIPMANPHTVDMPMPSNKAEVEQLFNQLVKELDMAPHTKKQMQALPVDKKWAIYCQKKPNAQPTEVFPEIYIEKLKELQDCMLGNGIFFEDSNNGLDLEATIESKVDNLKTALRTQPARFVQRYVDKNGLSLLLSYIKNLPESMKESRIHLALLGCMKSLMNDKTGRQHILAHPNAILLVAAVSLQCENLKIKIAALDFLGGVCLLPGGHKKVLEALCYFQESTGDRTRFSRIIADLERGFHYQMEFEVELKTTIMMFLNALLKGGIGESQSSENLEFRLHLRYELLCLGIAPLIERLVSKYDDQRLNKHIDVFQSLRKDDEAKFANVNKAEGHIDAKSSNELFKLIRKKCSYTEAWQPFMSVLYHLALIPPEIASRPNHWLLIEKCIQSIVMQKPDGEFPDKNYLDSINLTETLQLLGDVHELKTAKETITKLKNERDEYLSKWQNQRNELDSSQREKNTALLQCEKANQKVQEMQASFSALEKNLVAEKTNLAHAQDEIHRLNTILSSGNSSMTNGVATPQPSKIPSAPPTLAPGPPPPPPPPIFSGLNGAAAPPVPGIPGAPPPPPVPGIPGAPPPPGLFQTAGNAVVKTFILPSKNLPKPSTKMKALNWVKLPETKLTGETIWNKLNEEHIFNQNKIDLDDFTRKFSAYDRSKRENSPNENSSLTRNPSVLSNGYHNGMSPAGAASQRDTELCLVDGRRAQNCAILLSKLKMSNDDIKRVLLACDNSGKINKEMFDQMMKYLPTDEEIGLMVENEDEYDRFAKADKFMFRVSKIDHFRQRFNCISFRKHFHDLVDDLKPKIEKLNQASVTVLNNKRFHSILEYVLAFGNFMNKGNRGNAYGFKLSSLAKLLDTKSSNQITSGQNSPALSPSLSGGTRTITLLHYLATILPPDILQITSPENQFYTYLETIQGLTVEELRKDLSFVRKGHQGLTTEITYISGKEETGYVIDQDQFLKVMKPFEALVNLSMHELDDKVAELDSNFKEVKKFYVEDTKTNSAEFFKHVFDFLKALGQAKLENEKHQEEVEQQRKKHRMLSVTRTAHRLTSDDTTSSRSSVPHGNHGSQRQDDAEFDNLVSALRNGEIFDIPNKQRVRATKINFN